MEMENPIFIDRRWDQQPDPTRTTSYHPASSRAVPVYGIDPIHERNSGPKVVRIPVHFVGSEQVDRTGSAVKIQKVFRGFLVRKCLKKVKDIEVQVDEIEEKLWGSEVVELLRKEEKEKLRMNETLMSLLFKLDSICGMDFGVKLCRKAVIRKAIALQERIDAIAAADSLENYENDDRLTEIGASVETENSDHPTSSSENSRDLEDSGNSMEIEGDDIIDVGVDCEVKVSGDNADVNDKRRNREVLEKTMEETEMQTKMVNALTKKKAKASATC